MSNSNFIVYEFNDACMCRCLWKSTIRINKCLGFVCFALNDRMTWLQSIQCAYNVRYTIAYGILHVKGGKISVYVHVVIVTFEMNWRWIIISWPLWSSSALLWRTRVCMSCLLVWCWPLLVLTLLVLLTFSNTWWSRSSSTL